MIQNSQEHGLHCKKGTTMAMPFLGYEVTIEL